MSPFKQALGNAKLLILCLLLALTLSFILNVMMGVMLYNVPKNMTVFVPAQVRGEGISLKAGEITPSQVYRFVYSTWTHLMSWSGSGLKMFPKRLQTNAPYLSQRFQNTLSGQMQQLARQGLLAGVVQVSFGANGSAFNPKNVAASGNGTWVVRMDIHSLDYVKNLQGNGSFAKAAFRK